MALMKAITTIGGWTMASRVLGFARDAIMAAILGAGPAAEAFVVAFRLPNLFRRLFAEGALNAALVPIYSERLEKDGEHAAIAFGGQAAAWLLLTMLGLSVLAMAFMPFVISVLAPGFSEDRNTFELAVTLSIVTFPYLTFMALSALLSGMLYTLGRFGAAAAAPALLNVLLIGALGLSAAGFLPGLPVEALAWGVFLGGVGQFLLVVWDCRRAAILPNLPRPRLTPDVKKLLMLMGPGVLSAGVLQINAVVATMLASLLPAGSVAHLYYADRIAQLPLGVIGVAISVALLPLLSRQLSADDRAGAKDSLNRSLEVGLLLTVPAAVALIVMSLPVIDVLFRRGAFAMQDAVITGRVLQAMAIGLPAVVLVKILSPAFFARQDTKTPLKIALVSMAANIGLALILMRIMGAPGIALAGAGAAWINTGLMGAILWRRGHLPLDTRFLRRIPRLSVAALLMGAGLVVTLSFLPWQQDWDLALRLLYLIALVAGGGAVFFGLAQVLGGTDLRQILGALRRKRSVA